MQEQIDFDWYNDNARFILEQQPGAFYSASQLQLQGDVRLGHIIATPINQSERQKVPMIQTGFTHTESNPR
jgi:hypothetical protein